MVITTESRVACLMTLHNLAQGERVQDEAQTTDRLQAVLAHMKEPVAVTLSRGDWRNVEDVLRRQARRDATTRNSRNRGTLLTRAADAIKTAEKGEQ